jgi:hypothetical protein
MAVLFIDGFDHYQLSPYTDAAGGTVNDFQLKGWDNGNAILNYIVSPRFARGGTGMGLANMNAGAFTWRPITAGRTFVIGLACRFPSAPDSQIFGLRDSGGSDIVDVRGNGAGKLQVTRAGTVLATSTNSVSSGVWYYLELKVTINSSTGAYELRVDGTSTNWVPAASGANTGNADAARFYIWGGKTNSWMDDLYIANGTAPNNDFMGPCKVATLRPAGPGNHSDWTGNGGVNFANVGEVVPDGDTTFNQSATANQIDTFVFDELPASSGSVYAVQHSILAKKDAGAARTIAPLQRSGGTDYAGGTQSLTTSYAFVREVLDVNPADSAAWAVSDVNDAEFGYKLIS